MMDLQQLAKKAENSKGWNFILNLVLLRMVPFNKPHKFWVQTLTPNNVTIKLPYKKQNLNHVKGLHVCALATVSEYASGLILLLNLNPKKYRIIMESIQVKYHYQGKNTAFTSYTLNAEEFKKEVEAQLLETGFYYKPCEIKTFNSQNQLLCTATVNWQIKNWSKVKTPV